MEKEFVDGFPRADFDDEMESTDKLLKECDEERKTKTIDFELRGGRLCNGGYSNPYWDGFNSGGEAKSFYVRRVSLTVRFTKHKR